LDELIVLRVTGRRKQHGVPKTKDRGVRADAEREHEDSGDGETRRFDQLPAREPKIMNHEFPIGCATECEMDSIIFAVDEVAINVLKRATIHIGAAHADLTTGLG
jgi:hypothetical protein